jgi:hypothetical protein
MSFIDREGGYVCDECTYLISSSVEEMEENDREIDTSGEESSLEVRRSREAARLSGGISTLRQEETYPQLPLQLLQDSSDSE